MFVLFLAIAIILKLFNPRIMGVIGESTVKSQLGKLDKTRYEAVHDVMVEASPGKTSQIDHVVFSPFGIFVIETKNYSGWIFGKETDRMWTQKIYKSSKRFYNPVIQNKGHVKALQAVLGLPADYFISIVAFGGGAELKKVQTTTAVIPIRRLVSHITDYTELKLSPADVQKYAKTITAINIKDSSKRQAHVQRARTAKAGVKR